MTEQHWSHRVSGVQQLLDARHLLATHLERHGVDSDPIDDAILVLSELATNAFEHDNATEVAIDVTVAAATITIDTAHAADDERKAGSPDPSAMMPPPTQVRGRGLAIVAAIASQYETRSSGGVRYNHVALAR